MGDPRVSQLDQVIDGQHRPHPIVGDDGERTAGVDRAVDEHDRHVCRDRVLDQGMISYRSRHDEALDLPVLHALEVNPLLVGVVVRVCEQGGVAGLGQLVLDASHDGRK